MMRWLLALVAGFLVLCGVGLFLTRGSGEEAPPTVAVPETQPAPPAPEAPVHREQPPAPRAPASAPPAPAEQGNAEPSLRTEDLVPDVQPAPLNPNVESALRQAEPVVQQCLTDNKGRFPGPQQFTVTFSLEGLADKAHFANVTLSDNTVNDPLVGACWVDALDQLHVRAHGEDPSLSFTYTFHVNGG